MANIESRFTVKQKQSSLEISNLVRDLDKFAYLQAWESGYSTVRFDLGVLTIQMADVKPYSNSSKVSLRLGNPLASSINGLKVKLKWRRVDGNGAPDNDNSKVKEVTFSETLNSGACTTVSVVLEGFPPAELGFIRFEEVAHRGISLNR